MKNFLLSMFLLCFLTHSCSKDEDCENPVDCLPPTTQTGEGTFGCLINGKAFIPGGHQLGGSTQNVSYENMDGGYYFRLTASNNREDQLSAVHIFLQPDELKEGNVYSLSLPGGESNFSQYLVGAQRFRTSEDFTGEIFFTKFNEQTGIVSGKFWFDAVNEEGDVVKIREGRFDMRL